MPDTADQLPAENRLLGIGLRALAMAFFACLSALVKWTAGHHVPISEIIFFRNAFAFIPVVGYILATNGPGVLRTQRPVAHFTRAIIGLTGMTLGFTATAMLPLAQVTALNFAAPLFMVGLSALLLKEQVGPHRWAAVAVGFAGVLIMLRPETNQAFSWGVVLALVSALCSAGAVITIREIGRTETGPAIVFYFTLAGMIWGLLGLPFGLITGHPWTIPSPWVLVGLIAAGVVGGVGQLLHTAALRLAPVAVIAPFDYTQLLWAGLLGYFIFDATPGPTTVLGAVVVAASGVYILFRETRRRRA